MRFASFDVPEWFSQLPVGMSPEETYALAAKRARAYGGATLGESGRP